MNNINQDLPYILSASTLVLKSENDGSGIKTLVVEEDKTFTLSKKPMHLIRDACHHYGTSLKVATNHAKHLLYNRHKVPILIAFNHGFPLIMIPTMSATSEQNVWIALHAIKNYKGDKSGHTTIQLINNQSIRINASEATIQRQLSLAYVLQLDYQNRFRHLNGLWFSPRKPYLK